MYDVIKGNEFGRTAAFISKGAITRNTRTIKRILGNDTMLMAVVKADGYGHGAVAAAKAAAEAGAEYFGVATACEGLELLENGIKQHVLVLGFVEREIIEDAVARGLEFMVFDSKTAKLISAAAERRGNSAGIHIKIDTGMGRLGFMPSDEVLEEILAISALPGIIVRGACSHLADSDEDPEFTAFQLSTFKRFCERMERSGVRPKIRHIANSGAILKRSCPGMNMARAGIVLYGLTPSGTPNWDSPSESAGLERALSWKSRLSFVKKLAKGSTLSYGRTYELTRDTLIGTVPVGYADGYQRANGNKARVIVNGSFAPVIGRVCMDQFMVDLTNASRAAIGDEVLLIGSSGNLAVTADELAINANTINYEVVCGISKRVNRIYTD